MSIKISNIKCILCTKFYAARLFGGCRFLHHMGGGYTTGTGSRLKLLAGVIPLPHSYSDKIENTYLLSFTKLIFV